MGRRSEGGGAAPRELAALRPRDGRTLVVDAPSPSGPDKHGTVSQPLVGPVPRLAAREPVLRGAVDARLPADAARTARLASAARRPDERVGPGCISPVSGDRVRRGLRRRVRCAGGLLPESAPGVAGGRGPPHRGLVGWHRVLDAALAAGASAPPRLGAAPPPTAVLTTLTTS